MVIDKLETVQAMVLAIAGSGILALVWGIMIALTLGRRGHKVELVVKFVAWCMALTTVAILTMVNMGSLAWPIIMLESAFGVEISFHHCRDLME